MLTALGLMFSALIYQSCGAAPDDPGVENAPWIGGKGDTPTAPDATVAIVQASKAYARDLSYADIKQLVQQAVELAGGLQGLIKNGATVVLKPNLVSKIDYTLPGFKGKLLPAEVNGVTTDYRVTRAVVELVRALNPSGKIFVLEGSAGDTGDVMAALRYSAASIPGVDGFIRLEADSGAAGDKASPKLVKVSLPQALHDKELYLNKIYQQASVVISLPTLKNHFNAVITGGVKNVGIGAAPGNIYGSYRASYVDHTSVKLHQWIRDFYLARPVDFVIMDGLQGIQNGPTPAYDISRSSDLAQDQKNMRLILAGRDAVAVDTIESLVMGWNPLSVEYLRLLSKDGKGQLDTAHIRVRGKQVDEVRQDFAGVLTVQSFGGAKVTDFTAPTLQLRSASVASGTLNLALTVGGDAKKVEVYVDGQPVGPLVTSGFARLAIKLPAGAAPRGGVVHVYDYFLNRASASFTLATQPQGGVPVVAFRRYDVQATGTIAPSGKLFVTYDWSRLPTCRATYRDAAGKLRRAFELRAFARFQPDGQIVERPLTGAKIASDPFVTAPDDLGELTLDVPAGATTVDLWFHNTNLKLASVSVPSCDTWDSNGGKDYRFTVDGSKPASGAPTLSFAVGRAPELRGQLARGGKLVVSYDWGRLPGCRAVLPAGQSFDLRAYARFLPGGKIVERLLAGKKLEPGDAVLTMPSKMVDFAFDVPAPASAQEPPVTAVELWFHNFNLNVGAGGAAGAPVPSCDLWDSNGGLNFRFPVDS